MAPRRPQIRLAVNEMKTRTPISIIIITTKTMTTTTKIT